VLNIKFSRTGRIKTGRKSAMSAALNDDPLHTAIPPSRLLLPPEPPMLAPGIVHSNFSVQGDARRSFLAWQERMSPVYDIRPSSKQAEDTFDASLSRYTIDNLSFFDFRTGPNLAVRSLGRVSTESVRDITFSVFMEGPPAQFLGGKPRSDAPLIPQVPSILALDMDQPCSIRSFHGRLLLLFVPRALVERSFPDAASLHGRSIHATTPLTRTLIEHLVALKRHIVGLSKEEAYQSFLTAVELLVAAVRARAGKAGQPVTFALADFIAEIKSAGDLAAQAHGATLTVSAVDARLAINGDRDALYSAVANLLQNAFKFTHPHTEVTLDVYALSDRILIDVKDHCGGLPPGSAERMFLPFTQNGPDQSGLGLGLSIARRSVESNGGVLSVRDVPGTGCVFTVCLPRYAVTPT
jgi:signal transduction histidine kinase